MANKRPRDDAARNANPSSVVERDLRVMNGSDVTVRTMWREEAACKGLDTGIFFPSTDAEAGAAKLVCAGCPVRDACLEWALASRQEDGVWGGMTDNERRRLRRRRRDAARRAAAAASAA
jgi:WhiB family transcriptional regulator, redox-sensing transcriptional regulator